VELNKCAVEHWLRNSMVPCSYDEEVPALFSCVGASRRGPVFTRMDVLLRKINRLLICIKFRVLGKVSWNGAQLQKFVFVLGEFEGRIKKG
jgi:hypothetical protein